MTRPDFGPQLTVDFDVEGRQVGSFSVPLTSSIDPLLHHRAPIAVLRRGTGPIVCLVSGAQPGDVTGTTVLQSLLRDIDLEHINGTLIIAPSLMPLRTAAKLNDTQIDYVKQAFSNDVLESADIIIEIGSGAANIDNAPHAAVWPAEDHEQNAIAEAVMFACGAPDSVRRFDPPHVDSLAWIASLINTPFIRLDIGRHHSTDKSSRQMGLSRIRNALMHTGVLKDGQFELHSTRILEVAKGDCYVMAPLQGLVHWHADVGGAVYRGNPIVEIFDPDRAFAKPVTIDARMDGVLLTKSAAALCYPDQCLAIIGDEMPR